MLHDIHLNNTMYVEIRIVGVFFSLNRFSIREEERGISLRFLRGKVVTEIIQYIRKKIKGGITSVDTVVPVCIHLQVGVLV